MGFLRVLCRQGGEFNLEYAKSLPELEGVNLTVSNVLDYVTVDKYNFATVSSDHPRALSSRGVTDFVDDEGRLVLLFSGQLRRCASHGQEWQQRLGM